MQQRKLFCLTMESGNEIDRAFPMLEGERRHVHAMKYERNLESWFRLALLLMAQAAMVASAYDTNINSSDEAAGFNRLVSWVRDNGGRVDHRLAVQKLEHGVRGGVALAEISEGEVLLFCPWQLVIGSSNSEQKQNDMCETVRAIERELRLQEESFWYPYLALDDAMVNSRLPTMWDAATLEELQGLPPQEDATRNFQWFDQECHGSELSAEKGMDDLTQQALLCFVTRASAVGMVPVYDLLNHHNGKRNAKVRVTETGVELVAYQTIAAGNEIYLSYGIKSASTMFRDYGFVESWPQIWNWESSHSADASRHSFVLFPDGIVAINPTEDFLRGIWQGRRSLAKFQRRAQQHTEEVVSLAELQRFQTEALELLQSLPTSVGEDRLLLEDVRRRHQNMSRTTGDEDERTDYKRLKDLSSAIDYRIALKEALLIAVNVSEVAQRALLSAEEDHYGDTL